MACCKHSADLSPTDSLVEGLEFLAWIFFSILTQESHRPTLTTIALAASPSISRWQTGELEHSFVRSKEIIADAETPGYPANFHLPTDAQHFLPPVCSGFSYFYINVTTLFPYNGLTFYLSSTLSLHTIISITRIICLKIVCIYFLINTHY